MQSGRPDYQMTNYQMRVAASDSDVIPSKDIRGQVEQANRRYPCIYTYIYAYMCTYIYAYMYTYMYCQLQHMGTPRHKLWLICT